MADGALSDGGRPQGRAEELVRILRELGFVASADLIASDILMRRREAGMDPVLERTDPSRVDGMPGRLVFQTVSDDGEAASPLGDEEVREVIREAFEDTIIAPLKMLREVTSLTQSLVSASGRTPSPSEAIPLVQLEDGSDGVAWCNLAAFEYAQEVERMIPRIMDWLSEAPSAEDAHDA